MTPEGWALIASLVALAGVLAKVVSALAKKRRNGTNGSSALAFEKFTAEESRKQMHEMETVIVENTKALESLGRAVASLEKALLAQSEFLRWLATEMTGKRPPPAM